MSKKNWNIREGARVLADNLPDISGVSYQVNVGGDIITEWHLGAWVTHYRMCTSCQYLRILVSIQLPSGPDISVNELKHLWDS